MPRRGAVLTLIVLFVWPCAVVGCAGDEGGALPTDPAADVHRELLTGVAEHVILPTYRQFRDAADTLELATTTYAESLAPEDLAVVRDAWRAAMVVWQRAEVLQVGPAGSMTEALGGQDMRAEIYSWPTVNPCRVDQELVEAAYEDVDAFASELTNVRGLDALEYLLFGPTDDNDCNLNSAINRNGDWKAVLTTGEMPARRAAYARTLSTLLVRDAEALLQVWERDDNGFLAELATAGVTSQVYPTAQEALNAVSDAMFYVDKQTKDTKLAIPAGVSGCDTTTCPQNLESRWANHSRENALANLQGLQQLFFGGPDPVARLGFDDILQEMGNDRLAEDLVVAIAQAINSMESIEGSLAQALALNPEAVVEAYTSVKATCDLLKTEFVSTLDLEVPDRAAGDND